MPIIERTRQVLNPTRFNIKRLAAKARPEEDEKYQIIKARSPLTWMRGLLTIRQSPQNKPSLLIHRY